MKPLKIKTLWTLDAEINGQMIQVYSSKTYFECSFKAKEFKSKTKIQKRKVITDKY
jgi:hypothetical protein